MPKDEQWKKLLLRMPMNDFLAVKREAQRLDVSVTNVLNFIISDFVKSQKLQP